MMFYINAFFDKFYDYFLSGKFNSTHSLQTKYRNK